MEPSERRDAVAFETDVPRIGRLWLRRLRLSDDLAVVHDWVGREYAKYWGLVGKSREEVGSAYAQILTRAEVYLGFHGDQPAFLVECYRPDQDLIGAHYPVLSGDGGMHVLVGPPRLPVHGFTSAVFAAVMDFLFSDPATERIVVEPDIRNTRIHTLNRRAGFQYLKMVELPTKTAHLATCTRARYLAARERRPAGPAPVTGDALIAHLRPEVWSTVNAALIRKAIAEFAHELILTPELAAEEGEWRHYVLAVGEVAYRFRARILALDHWDLAPGSLSKVEGGEGTPLDAMAFFLEFAETLGIAETMLPVYLEEIASTLYGAAYKVAHQQLTAADLVHAEFQEIETAMTEGHPSFVANSGRIGFDAVDYRAYAPEAGAPVRLVWLAAHRRNTEFSVVDDLSYGQLIREELGPDTLARFDDTLAELGLDPTEYLLLPVHPWQWYNRLALVFSPDLATQDLVCLGFGEDTYRAQQSIRTFFNLDRPHHRYVKTALSVLNMGFMRGLSADYMRNTPAINDWLHQLLASDPTFARHGFGILREVAGIGYRNPRFEAALPKQSPYRKMLAALWRESPVPQVRPGQRLMTMAALLHRDRDGLALLPQLIRASGLDIDTWLRRYLDCYLAPLMHCLYRYALAFMPHGENVILLLEDNVPVRVFMKDIAEEVAVMDPSWVLPDAVRRIAVSVPDDFRTLSIFTDVFDGILRYQSQILLEQESYPTERFWRQVAECVLAYQRAHPELADAFASHDLFAPRFRRSCLNRLQLRNNVQMVDLTDPATSLSFVGTLENPIAGFRS